MYKLPKISPLIHVSVAFSKVYLQKYKEKLHLSFKTNHNLTCYYNFFMEDYERWNKIICAQFLRIFEGQISGIYSGRNEHIKKTTLKWRFRSFISRVLLSVLKPFWLVQSNLVFCKVYIEKHFLLKDVLIRLVWPFDNAAHVIDICKLPQVKFYKLLVKKLKDNETFLLTQVKS